MGMREKDEDIRDAVERGGPPYSDKYYKAMAAIVAALAEADKRDADYQRAREAWGTFTFNDGDEAEWAVLDAHFNPQPSQTEREGK